ncbi:uncharacterized protein LOC126894035 [Daktulosphaira vitifoliae]|uniref:uncharacterized protein LOC126894035 n=1 Tax=Daktulosphaira vitifoliae TaxID=58002 RepID=UPI0021AA57B0|nr:uncharacterized protein LOC126894035 [Daktulosphaira vitifoliae]
MIKNFLLFMFIIWHLSKALSMSSLQTTISENFKDYIIKSLNHICKQSGWNTIGHIHFQKRGYTINNYCIIKDSVNDNNYLEKLECIINILNCEYTIVMENFNVMLGIVLDKCPAEKIKSNMEQFDYCINGIFDIFKNLVNIFANFLNAAKYINQIDLRIISLSLNNSKCIESEIQLFCSHLSKVVEQYNVNTIEFNTLHYSNIFEEMMNFHKNVEHIILKLYKIRKVCGSHYESPISTNLLTVYNIEQMDKLVDDSNDYVNNIYNDLSTYLAVISKNHFSSLGFEQLLGTNTFEFIHCIIGNVYNTSNGIKLMKTLISHDYWTFWKHISIKNKLTNFERKHFDELIVPVNLENYKFIRVYTTQILRCRYIEIFEFFNDMLDRIIKFCQFNNKNSCAITIFNIIIKSDEMFKNMLFALKTLRYMVTHKNKRDVVSRIELLIEFFRNFIFDMRRKYQSSSEFTSHEYYEATEFLNDIKIFTQKELSIKIDLTNRYSKAYCEFEGYSDLFGFMISVEKLIKIDTPCILGRINIYQAINEIFSEFMKKINRDNYENLGFNKIEEGFF